MKEFNPFIDSYCTVLLEGYGIDPVKEGEIIYKINGSVCKNKKEVVSTIFKIVLEEAKEIGEAIVEAINKIESEFEENVSKIGLMDLNLHLPVMGSDYYLEKFLRPALPPVYENVGVGPKEFFGFFKGDSDEQ